jgi:hypothetical protein
MQMWQNVPESNQISNETTLKTQKTKNDIKFTLLNQQAHFCTSYLILKLLVHSSQLTIIIFMSQPK